MALNYKFYRTSSSLARILMILLAGILFFRCSDPEIPQDVQQAMKTIPASIDYNLHVKPILSDRCFSCHGPDKNKLKANLRLDIPTALTTKAESGKMALVPGNLAKSELFHRIISNDPEYLMPSPESHLTLSAEEKAILIQWIKDGAEYKPHWSLVAAKKSSIPEVKNKSWIKNPIDNFVLSKLEEKQLKPNKEANKENLIRRVSFDLTGLPPTIDEVDAFLSDQSENAYEKLVDRLLASPHYGERMAVDWLDVARYADTHGYQDDGMRNAYPWRDWVIDAFNKNLSYDQFITWQLAGDLLPDATREQILATCFLRNHPQSQEGGIVDEEYRVEYVADRVNTFGKAFLAISTECARCHDHKFDPISQKNYFQLFSFFNSNNESGQIPYTGEASPTLILTTKEVEAQLEFLRSQTSPLEKEQDNNEKYKAGFENWVKKAQQEPNAYGKPEKGLLGYFPFDDSSTENEVKSPLKAWLSGGEEGKKPVSVESAFGQGFRVDGDMGIHFNEHLNFERNQPFSISLRIKTLKDGESGPVLARTNGELDAWRGYIVDLNKDQTLKITFSHVFPANAIHLETREKLIPNEWHHLALTYDGSSKAKGVNFFINGKETPLLMVHDNLKQSLMYAKDKREWGIGSLKLGQGGNRTLSNVVFDEFNAFNREISLLEVKELGEKGFIENVLRSFSRKQGNEDKELLFEYYIKAFDKEYELIQKELIALRGEENEALTEQEEVMVFAELKKPRPAFVLERGEYDAPAEEVQSSTPESILPFDETLPKNRLGLSRWLISEEQPLFNRVIVNRFWQQLFGQGIVKSSDDFGNQGEMPTHPELLDWLAVTFREEGWDVKKMLKMMVMSATYRQSSIPTKENLASDPDNLLFTRAPSYRMSSEMLRDNALVASGLLVRDVGGKSVYPYQPEGVWEALAVRNSVKYEQGKGDDLYRRSLYTVWKRSSPNPAMINFDVPDRYMCVVRRQKTSTPLQALVLMNDEQFVEAARVLGEKMIREGGNTAEGQITYGFRALTSRYPKKEEMDILKSLYEQEKEDFTKNTTRAALLLKEGDFPVDKSLSKVDVATCTIVASTLMNFDEFVFKR